MSRLALGVWAAAIGLVGCGAGAGFQLSPQGAEAKAEAEVDESVKDPGTATFATATEVAASAELDAITELRTVGYRVSSDFHDDGKIRFALIPRAEGGAPILDEDVHVSFRVESNVPFPIEGSARIAAVHPPAKERPLQTVFDVDGSGSMSSTDPDRKRIDAALRFASTLSDQDERNEIAVFEFADGVDKRSDLTTVPEITREQLEQVGANGSTRLHDSMLASIDDLVENGEQGYQRAILLLTDGMDTASDAGPDDVVEKLRQHDVVVYGVSLGGAADVPGLNFVGPVQRYTAASEGIYAHVEDAGELVDKFETVALARTHGWIEVEATLQGLGGVFVPFSKMRFEVEVSTGGAKASERFSFIVPLELGG